MNKIIPHYSSITYLLRWPAITNTLELSSIANFFLLNISEKVARARKGIGNIRHLSFHVPLDVLDQLYKLFVRPLLDYCDIIYHVPAITNPFNSSISLKYSMQSIESTQYQAALASSGAWKGSNTSKLYEELGWESLTDRRWYRRLLQFYKIINDLAPSYLKDIIPPPPPPPPVKEISLWPSKTCF